MIVYTILADKECNPRANFRCVARCSGCIRRRNSPIAATRSALPHRAGDGEPSPAFAASAAELEEGGAADDVGEGDVVGHRRCARANASAASTMCSSGWAWQ
jgi:hypothetical protein